MKTSQCWWDVEQNLGLGWSLCWTFFRQCWVVFWVPYTPTFETLSKHQLLENVGCSNLCVPRAITVPLHWRLLSRWWPTLYNFWWQPPQIQLTRKLWLYLWSSCSMRRQCHWDFLLLQTISWCPIMNKTHRVFMHGVVATRWTQWRVK